MPGFGTAGVRGIFNSTQTLGQVYSLAEASAFVFGAGKYAVGWDGRKTSVILARVVASAINAVGSDAISLGLVPTPVVAFGTREYQCLLGFSVTASHNPPEFSGVKVFNNKGMEISKEEEGRIERGMMVASHKSAKTTGGTEQGEEVLDRYIDSILGRFGPTSKKLKIVVDCANGPGGMITPHVLTKIGHRVVSVNGQVSWKFPARLPEPTADNLRDTGSIVSGVGADLGFAHDGDADRLVMIDRAGRVVPDSVMSIVALRALEKKSGSVILSENTSTAVQKEAESLGLRVVRARIGKTFIEIEREQAIYATEPSKVIDPSWGLWEDGMYCTALICDALVKDSNLFDLVNGEPEWKYKQVNLPISVSVEILAQRVIEVFERFRILEVRRLDGLKVIFRDESWVMFRTSGTEAKTRIYCESKDQFRLEELVDSAKKLLDDYVSSIKTRW